MLKNEILNSPTVLQAPIIKNLCTHTLLFLEVGESELIFLWGINSLTANKKKCVNTKKCVLPPKWRGLVLLDKSGFEIISGNTVCYEVNPLIFSKLLVFADVSRDTKISIEHKPIMETIAIDATHNLLDKRAAEHWFIYMIVSNNDQYFYLAEFLRKTEQYWLVHFLFNSHTSGNNLHALGKHYGVSDSHFRRLCRQALGDRTKKELRIWRVARALLDMTDRSGNFTEIAIKHGYASSSHFSNDVKDLLGVSPRGLSDILNLAKK